ncbi:hypothetical protein [Cloacibacterium sp.]|uniref:hypothetical protein n=1 Tax=Cloacibacterium sp. TaxID=1913682 RepID=UPI0039E38BE8
MKKTQPILTGVVALLFGNILFGQEKPKEWDVSLYGFARADYIFDSRKSAYVREYNLNLYPLDVAKDTNGEDKNATGSSNFLSVTSRIGVKFKGPDVFKAKISGNIEGDFFGNTEVNANTSGTGSIGLFRLRHATIKLDWTKTSLTFGQTWYPTFVPEVFPGVANFNTGIMFNPFGWASQIRFKQKLSNKISLDLVAYKDREFTASSVTGTAPNTPSFNSTIPTLHGQLQFKNKNIVAGVGAEFQSLKPVTESGGLVSDEKLNSSTVFGYFKYSNDDIIAKFYGISGGNLTHLVMLGGYGSYANSNGIDSYKPTRTSAFWLDIASNKQKIAPGIFAGYTKNNGLSDAGYKALYMRGLNGTTRAVDNVWRVSARVDFKENKFKLTPEVEYTAATWGTMDTSAKVTSAKENVGNFRALVSATYSF